MSVDVRVNGFCPMGCGETLELNISSGDIICIDEYCPRPYAMGWILQDDLTDHIVNMGETDFNMKHPLRERVEGELLDCELSRYMSSLSGPPDEPGEYLVFKEDGGWVFERLDVDD